MREWINSRIAWYGGLLLGWVFVAVPITTLYVMVLSTVAAEHWPTMPQWLVLWNALAVTAVTLAPAAYFASPLGDELVAVWRGESNPP